MRQLLLGISLCLILLASLLSFTVAACEPPERNIVYIHVPAAVSGILCMFVLFISSLQYLRTGQTGYDFTAAASAEVGLVFAVVTNLTGSIFARAEWGLWWTPSPRLITSAVMLFLLVAYLLLRAALAGNSRKERICAVLGIITFIDVPLIIISARFVRDIHRPGVSFQTPWQYAAFVSGILGMAVLALALIWLRADMLNIKNKIDSEI